MSTDANPADLPVVPLPPTFATMDAETQQLVIAYLQQLNPLQQKAYEIAMECLESSFDLVRTGGYLEWRKSTAPK